MKTLLVHPGDRPDSGPWAAEKWSRVVDLGLGGAQTYGRWSKVFGCEVVSLESYRNGFQEILRVRDLLAQGRGCLIDGDGLDWWELMAIEVHSQLEVLILLERLMETVAADEDVYVTRPGMHADMLKVSLQQRLRVFPSRHSKAARYVGLGKKFSIGEMTQIFWDKYDPQHQIRGRLARKPRCSQKPVVLVPTAYLNVTRTSIAYARTVPDMDFLIVATRRSGWVENLPSNVGAAWFAAYTSFASKRHLEDQKRILAQWAELRRKLEAMPEFSVLSAVGLFELFEGLYRQGLRQRDIWTAVFEKEPVQAVLCADDSNPSTLIPVLVAKKFGAQAISCHHGALDGRYMIKRNHSDMILAKGEMERDYLVRVCGVPADEVEIGAPKIDSRSLRKDPRLNSRIVLFSEVYEVSSGRPDEFYREMVPALADIALAHGKKLTVKLHPIENERERKRMIAAVLSDRQRSVVEVVSKGTASGLLQDSWFAVTVLSTVAIECLQLGVPCFLCHWLEFWPYGYIEQFTRYGVGYGLKSPSELARIPEILRSYEVPAHGVENLMRPIDPRRLKELFTAVPVLDGVPEESSLDRAG